MESLMQYARSQLEIVNPNISASEIPPHLATAQNFYLPSIPCSTIARLNPFYDVVRETFDPWLIAFSQPRDEATERLLIQTMVGLFVCLSIPDAVQHKILPLCKISAVIAIVDDFVDESSQLGNSEKEYYDFLLSLLEGQPRSSDNWKIKDQERMCDALLDAWKDIRASMAPRQQERFIQSVRDYFYASLLQSRMREEKGIVDLQTYQCFRRFTGAGYVYMIMAEYGNDLDLDDDVLANPAIIKLQEVVASHVAYVNDLLSFRKEFCHGQYQNLPSIFCVHEDCSLQESIFRVCEMIHNLDEDFKNVCKQVLDSKLAERPGVRSYMNVIGYVMSGFLEWAYQTGRYHGLDNHRLPRVGMVSLLDPDRTIITQDNIKSTGSTIITQDNIKSSRV